MEIISFTQEYIKKLKDVLDKIDPNIISQIVDVFEKTVANKSRIFIFGNGGSASTASHMVNDLGPGLRRRNIINLNVLSLGDNSPAVTAIANDIGYENIFYMQIKGQINVNDVVVAISCSGNSANIIKAVDYAKEIGCKIIGISGFDGGYLKKVSDINFHIETKKGDYGIVEDSHLILDHIIYSYYMQRIKSSH